MVSLLKEIMRPLYYFLKNKNLREFYRLLDKYGSYERFISVNNLRFLNYKIDVPDLPSFIWQFKEIFVDEIYKFDASNSRITPLIYDCGANIGMSVLYFKTMFPNAKIIAFEADPKICKYLRENLKKNGINNVDVIEGAVWINNDEVEFNSEGVDGGSIYGKGNIKKVKSVRLKELLEKEKEIDLLKIDIEGAEYEVLMDCRDSLRNVRNIFVEYHSWNNKEQKLGEILKVLEENIFRYYLKTVNDRKWPFIKQEEDQSMDLQINIWGYRV
jgi:FkbM family methyltransferase